MNTNEILAFVETALRECGTCTPDTLKQKSRNFAKSFARIGKFVLDSMVLDAYKTRSLAVEINDKTTKLWVPRDHPDLVTKNVGVGRDD